MSNFTVFQNTQFEELIEAIKKGGGGGSYTLPPATAETLGGIKVGDNLTVEEDGTLNAETPTLPIASTTTLGGVKVGSGLSISSDGTLTATGGGGGGGIEYSTEEHIIGNWMGKDLYSKTFYMTFTDVTVGIYPYNLGLTNIADYFIDYNHSFVEKLGNNARKGIMSTAQNTSFKFSAELIKTTTNEIRLNINNPDSGYMNKPFVVTVEYTKLS